MAKNPLERFPLAYCETCKCARPYKFAVVEADHLNDHAYADMLCTKCYTIIATVSERPQGAIKRTLGLLVAKFGQALSRSMPKRRRP